MSEAPAPEDTPEEPAIPEASDAAVPEVPAVPAARIKCAFCHKPFSDAKKFCPHCGRAKALMKSFAAESKEFRKAEVRDAVSWLELRQAIWFYVTLLGCNFIAVYLIPDDKPWGMILSGSTIVLSCAIWPFCTKEKLLGERLKPHLPLLKLAIIPLIAVVTFYGTLSTNWLAMKAMGLTEINEKLEGIDGLGETQFPLWSLIVAVCVIPGIFEELFFRGYWQSVLEKSLSAREAWIVQAIIFAIAHLNPLGFFTYLIWLGLLFGWLRNKTGSLIPGMLVHFSHNFLVVLAERGMLPSF